MYCIIIREKLLKSLRYVLGILKSRPLIPVLYNILLEVKAGVLLLIGTDLEMELSSTIILDDVYECGIITVSARKLYDICRASPKGEKIILNLKNEKLLINFKNSSFALSTILSSDFPYMDLWEQDSEFIFQKSILIELIGSVKFAMGLQDTRHYLNGMLFEVNKNKLSCVATDGHRLAISTTLMSNNTLLLCSVIIPRRGIIEILRIFHMSLEDIVTVHIGKFNIRVIIGNIIFISKLIDGSFPDYHNIISKDYNNILEVNREILYQSLKRIAILSNEKFHGVKFHLNFNKLKITTNNSIYEEAEEIIDVLYHNNPIEIGFNVLYLLDILDVIKCDYVQFFFQDESSSILVIDCLNKCNSYIIMPMKL